MDGNVLGPTLQVWASIVVRGRLAHGRTLTEPLYLRGVPLVEHPFTNVLQALRPLNEPLHGGKRGYQNGASSELCNKNANKYNSLIVFFESSPGRQNTVEFSKR